MPTQCKPISFAFQGCQGRKVTAAFDGGSIMSNAGALLLRAADRSIRAYRPGGRMLHGPSRCPPDGALGPDAGC